MVTTRSTSNMTPTGALEHVLGTVLGYPADHQVRVSLNYLGVHDINALTFFRGEEFNLPYYTVNPNDESTHIENQLIAIDAKRLAAIVDWYYSQEQQKLTTWSQLTSEQFTTWYDQTQRPAPAAAHTAPAPIPTTTHTPKNTFRTNLKINLSDYPKLKEDKQWRTYNRLLKATAANHDTLQILDHTYLPPPEDTETFTHKQYFMYNVFSQNPKHQ